MFPAGTQHRFNVHRMLFVRYGRSINVERTFSACWLKFWKASFPCKVWNSIITDILTANTQKTTKLVSNTNRQIGFCLINILLHISKNVLGIVWWFHEFTNILRPYSETRHKTQETQKLVESSEISTISVWTISFIIALIG